MLKNVKKCLKNIKKVLDKPYFVSQSTALMKQLKEFQRNEKNIALVVDEYGEIQGLVSIEDIFKEIVGKFESDKVELNKEFFELKDGAVIAEGNSRIRDLNNHLKWNLPEDGPKTINGLITEFLETTVKPSDPKADKLVLSVCSGAVELLSRYLPVPLKESNKA